MLKRMCRVALIPLLLLLALTSFSQEKVITGTIKDSKDGTPLAGVSVTVKGGRRGTETGPDGTFRITVAAGTTSLVVSFVGYETQTVNVAGQSVVNVGLTAQTQGLNDIVVVGYGTARKKDLTGSISTLQAKDFNRGLVVDPDQLLQGKIAGLEITVNSGQPGAATTVKIRGNNSIRGGTTPLYVIDGVPLDGRDARAPLYQSPTSTGVSGLGNVPQDNPLIYLNPADIASVTVLEDASASAIYGSRGANGVILITTKQGTPGTTRLEAGMSWGVTSLMKQPDILSANQYVSELAVYGAKSDSGARTNPFNQILQKGISQNYTLALSGGNENGHYRASFLASNQNGLLLKSSLAKYVGDLNGQYYFMDRKLSITFGITAGTFTEHDAPISNDAGSTGNMVSAAMNWNPTINLRFSNGAFDQVNPSGQINPLALSTYYDDINYVTTILGNITASYKILPNLEYKMLYGTNYSVGLRNNQLQGDIVGTGANSGGDAFVAHAQLGSNDFTQTLTYSPHLTKDLRLDATAGYEYWTTSYATQCTYVFGFDYNIPGGPQLNIPYYSNMQDGEQANLKQTSFVDPSVELQSYFGRAVLNWQDKYVLTATYRVDGSSRFGVNNRYADFPSVAGLWNITKENFMRSSTLFDNLDLRIGYGQTGSQDGIPAGASESLAQYQSNGGNTAVVNYGNANLRWETVTATNAGIDFSILKGRVAGKIDGFLKKTTNPLFLGTLPVPSNGANIWQNLPGYITNKGVAIDLNAVVWKTKDWEWDLGGNLEYVRNQFVYPAIGTSPLFLTGAIDGQGVSSAFGEAIANKQPIDVFYLRQFEGFDKNGIAIVKSQASSYSGDPNPHVLVGIHTELDYKKFGLTINTHGAFGYLIYNNTRTSVTNLGNITNGKNISKTLIGTQEGLADPVSASTRFLESGNYLKFGNMTLFYSPGNVGKYLKDLRISLTGTNVFELTKYHGFDAEVNVDHNNSGVPSLGMDYIGYPTARIVSLGINFGL